MADSRPDFAPTAWRPSLVQQGLTPRGVPVGNSDELTRILNLPRRPAVEAGTAAAEALIEWEMRKYSLGPRACRCREIDPKRPCIQRLLWLQAWMLNEIRVANGLIANVFVGAGKTLSGILAPLALIDCKLALLLIPPSLVDQIIVDYQLIAEHFRVPGLVVHLSGRRVWKREPRLAPGGGDEPMLHVLPYSRLSSIDSSDWIERLQPDAVIADEVDSLKDMESARAMRVMRFFESSPNTRFCGWTGSLTDNSIKEMAHLAALALRYNSPLPIKRKVIDEWSMCLDAVPNPSPPGALIRLLEPGEPATIAAVRVAMRRRMAETRGCIMLAGRMPVITSAGQGVEIQIRERKAPPMPEIVAKALDMVRHSERPDTLAGNEENEILADPMEQARCAREVATGMFYRWIFPRGEPRALVLEWLRARKEWNSELRQQMLRGEVNLDSPKLCENAARRAWGDAPSDPSLPEWHADAWPRWRDIMDQVEPKTEAVRLHSFLVEDAARWGIENRGIIWYGMVEFAQWVSEVARGWGHDLPIHGGGPNAGKRIMEERGDRSIIASINSHGRGRDRLQYAFNKQLIANMFSSNRRGQQLLGRLRRRGQECSQILTEVYLHCDELRDAFDQALRRGEYTEQVTGEKQELVLGWHGDDE